MVYEDLTDRQRKVLEAIVRNYIVNASPAGSRFLAKQSGINRSAATIRNVMSDLEEMGYISQPHTSAGRVPTDKGYRWYVDTMIEQCEPPEPVMSRIRRIIEAGEPTDLHMLMEATSRALSLATDQLGITLAPLLSRAVFRHIHIFEMAPHRFVLHMTVDSGFVRTLTIELECDVARKRLANACEVINERFYGMHISEIAEREDDVLRDVEPLDLGVVRLFVPSIKKMLKWGEDTEELYTEGETNIVLKPEFTGRERLGAVFELLSDRRMLMHLFDTREAQVGKVIVSIGGENRSGVFESFSIVKARYQMGGLEGSLGVLGPKRAPYPLLVAAVNYTARLLGELHR
jgi:heat-inducible transcriptional repressor